MDRPALLDRAVACIEISEHEVSRLMPRAPRKPPSQTWRTFLTNHVGTLASIDFFTVPTATFRVLYVFVVLAPDRRRGVHFNVTEHPTAAWTAQQIVEAFPGACTPKYLMRARDRLRERLWHQVPVDAAQGAPCEGSKAANVPRQRQTMRVSATAPDSPSDGFPGSLQPVLPTTFPTTPA